MSIKARSETAINDLKIAAQVAQDVFSSGWRKVRVKVDTDSKLTYHGWGKQIEEGMTMIAEYVDEYGQPVNSRNPVGLKLNPKTGFYEAFYDSMDKTKVNEFKYEYAKRKIKSLAGKFEMRGYKLMKEEVTTSVEGTTTNYEFVNPCGNCMA
jgi:hypothetical protein